MPAENSVTISILGKEYQIGCPPEEEESLRQSARYLNEQMKQVKSRGATLGFEKVAILAALNISHELVTQGKTADQSNTLRKLKSLEEKIDSALVSTRQMEI